MASSSVWLRIGPPLIGAAVDELGAPKSPMLKAPHRDEDCTHGVPFQNAKGQPTTSR
jgi:hypothetical protein